MSKTYSITELRNNFSTIIHNLKVTGDIEITRRRKPVAVLLSKQGHDRLQNRSSGFWTAYENFRKQVELTELNINPSEIFNVREL